MYIKNFLRIAAAIGLMLIAISCGGGGGGGSSTGSSGNSNNGNNGGTIVTSTQRAVSSGDVDLLLSSIASSGKKHKNKNAKLKKGRNFKETLDSDSLSDKTCLLFFAKLSDNKYSDLVALLKTDSKGSYELKTEDIFDYLKLHLSDVGETSAFADLDPKIDSNRDRILEAFKKLGVLRVRAMYEDDSSIVAMEYFLSVSNADPNKLENSDPRNRIIAHWVEKIFNDLGIIPTEEQYEALKEQISSMTDKILTGLTLPEGTSLEDFANAFKTENSLILTDEQKALIKSILESTATALTDEEKEKLSELGGVSHANVNDGISNEVDETLSGLISSLGSQIQEKIEEVLKDPLSNPAFAKLLSSEGIFYDINSDTFKEDFDFDAKSKESLIRFFVSLGFPVEVQAGDGSNEPLFAMIVPMPGNVTAEDLPGSKGFGDRNIRLFKISDISKMVTDANALFVDQTEVDTLIKKPFDTLSADDKFRLGKLKVVHDFIRHLKHSPPMVSTELLSKIMEVTDDVSLNSVATTMSTYFVWRQESISFVDDGKGHTVPVFTGELVSPNGGDSVLSTDLVTKLSVKLGADPVSAVDSLTNNDSFMFQFIGEAIREGVNLAQVNNTTFSFPKNISDARTLIKSCTAFLRTKETIVRGLITAFPPAEDEDTLYDLMLTGDTELNARSAIFFVTFLFHSKYQVDSSLSYFDDTNGRPRMGNDKFLVAKDKENFSLVTFMCSLLNITEFTNSSAFLTAEGLVKLLGGDSGLDKDLYKLPEFKDNGIPKDINKKAAINAKMQFKFYDNRTDADIATLVSASAVPVTLGANGPEIADGTTVNGTVSVDATDTTLFNIDFASVPTGKQYLIAITVTDYTHDVPELFFFADGFADPLLITRDRPFIIPPDAENVNVPGLALLANHKAGPPGSTPELMGADLSNLEEGLPPILPISFDGDKGYLDLRLAVSAAGDYSLETTFTGLTLPDGESSALIAPLYVNWTGTSPVLSVKGGTDFERLSDPNKAMGLSFTDLVIGLVEGDLTTQAVLCNKSATAIKTYFEKGQPLYLMKDRKGIFWLIAVRRIDSSIDQGIADIGFVKIASDGKLAPPIIRKQDVFIDPNNPMVFINLHYGDFAYFPNKTEGGIDLIKWGWSAPKQVPFGYNDSVATVAQIRYAGEDFNNRVSTGDAAQLEALNAYIKAGDFTAVPSRLDYYGPAGGGLSVVKFDSTTFTWPTFSGLTYTTSATNLVSGDIVLIRFGSSGDADLVCLVDKKTENPARDNFQISLLAATFSDAMIQVSGVAVDADKDGYLGRFDPNDNDPNIKPFFQQPDSANKEGNTLGGPSNFTGIFANEGGSKFIFVDVMENVDEVYQLSVKISVKKSDGSTVTFPADGTAQVIECTPADFSSTTPTPPSGLLKSGSSISIEDVSFGNMNFELIAAPSDFTAGGTFEPGSKVTFDYEFTFRPRDPTTGLVISDVTLFGTNPARPSFKGSSVLQIPALAEQVGDFDKSSILVQIGTDTPAQLLDSARLEPQKETKFEWGAVTNASFYEFSIQFEGSSDAGLFLPHWRMDFMVPSDSRKVSIPMFMLPQGRSGGYIQIIARRMNALGQPTFDGTVISFASISTTGDATTAMPGGGINDIKLKSGDGLYYHSDTKMVNTTSTGGTKLFTIVPSGTSATITLSPTISAEGDIGAPPMTKKLRKSLKTTFGVGSVINVTPGTYLRFFGITLTDGSVQPVDVSFSGFRTDEVVLQAFLPPSFKDISTGGSFDVNGDATNDVTYDGTSTLTFVTGISVTKQDQALGPVVISTDGVPTVFAIPVATTHQDFELKFSDGKRYWFFIDMTMKTVQWGEIFGEVMPPPTNGIFSGTLKSGDNLDFDNVVKAFAITAVTSSKNVVNFSSGKILPLNGWQIGTIDNTSTFVSVTDVTPAVNDIKVYRIKNTTINIEFDMEETLFASGELNIKLMPPNNTGSTGGGNNPPPDPFATNTFVYTGLLSVGMFLDMTQAAPFVFSTSSTSGANTALSITASNVSPAAGWVLYNELNVVVTSIVPSASFASFFRAENTTLMIAFSGFMKLEGADTKIGVMNANSFGTGGGGGTFTGLFQTSLAVDEYFTVNDDGTTATFMKGTTNQNTPPQTTLFKFASTNEIVPQNGWAIYLFNGTSFVAATGPVFATSTNLNTKLKHTTDLREFNIDFKLDLLNVKVGVMNMFRGTLPPPPGILIGSGEYYNRTSGAPTTFSMSAGLLTGAPTESIANVTTGVVTGANTWQIYDLSNVLQSSYTPTVAGAEVFFKSSNVSETEKYRVKLTLDSGTGKIAFEIKNIINIPPPVPGILVSNGEFFNRTVGAPTTFAMSPTLVSGVSTESIANVVSGVVSGSNTWQIYDLGNALQATYTPTVAGAEVFFKSSNVSITESYRIKLTLDSGTGKIAFEVKNIIVPPPPLFDGVLNLNEYLNGDINIATPVFNPSPTLKDGIAPPANIISLIQFSSANTFTPVNGFTVTDMALTPVVSYTVPDTNVAHQFIIKNAAATKTFKLEIGMQLDGKMRVIVKP